MSVHTIRQHSEIYFITFTCHNWLPLIEQTNSYDLVYKWFDILHANGHSIAGYVIMPNHLHLLLHYKEGGQTLNTIIGNAKRFMAYEIVDRLRMSNNYSLLEELSKAVGQTDRNRGKKHQVWEQGFESKPCRTEKFLLQKLHYIHNNPCTGKWSLADSTIHYQHSSASQYITGRPLGYRVRDYQEIFAENMDE